MFSGGDSLSLYTLVSQGRRQPNPKLRFATLGSGASSGFGDGEPNFSGAAPALLYRWFYQPQLSSYGLRSVW